MGGEGGGWKSKEGVGVRVDENEDLGRGGGFEEDGDEELEEDKESDGLLVDVGWGKSRSFSNL